MPLFDHFRGTLGWRSWESLYGRWSGAIADDLNRRLPKRLVADAPVYLGSRLAADVVEPAGRDVEAGVALAAEVETYEPQGTELSMPASFPTEIKVEVRDLGAADRLLAVVELVGPSTKESEREQFAAKCLGYLGKGIGLVVIDVVTERHWNLHNELVRIAKHDDKFLMPDDAWLYTTAYRPVSRKREDLIDLWRWPLKVGEPLPAVPLALKSYGCVKLDLEATYTEACTRLRIPE